MKFLILILLCSLPIQLGADVNIIVKGITHSDGLINVLTYLDSKTWLKADQHAEHIIVKATKGDVIVPLERFRGGTIAAVAYHDENGDGKLNRNLFGIPKEAFAFSNSYTPKSLPKYRKAAITIPDNSDLIIILSY